MCVLHPTSQTLHTLHLYQTLPHPHLPNSELVFQTLIYGLTDVVVDTYSPARIDHSCPASGPDNVLHTADTRRVKACTASHSVSFDITYTPLSCIRTSRSTHSRRTSLKRHLHPHGLQAFVLRWVVESPTSWRALRHGKDGGLSSVRCSPATPTITHTGSLYK